MNQLSLYDNTFVPLFLQLIGSYCSPVVLYIYFRSKLRRKFKPTDSLKVVCACVCWSEREREREMNLQMDGDEKACVCVCVCVCVLRVPDDVYVSVLGSQVERRRPVGVRGVSFFGLQQSSTHVTGQQQLDHLHTHTYTHTHTHTHSTSNTFDDFCRLPSAAASFFFFNKRIKL